MNGIKFLAISVLVLTLIIPAGVSIYRMVGDFNFLMNNNRCLALGTQGYSDSDGHCKGLPNDARH